MALGVGSPSLSAIQACAVSWIVIATTNANIQKSRLIIITLPKDYFISIIYKLIFSKSIWLFVIFAENSQFMEAVKSTSAVWRVSVGKIEFRRLRDFLSPTFR